MDKCTRPNLLNYENTQLLLIGARKEDVNKFKVIDEQQFEDYPDQVNLGSVKTIIS